MRVPPVIRRLGQCALLCVTLAAVEVRAAPVAGSAYYTDPQRSYVQDQTGAGIAEVNMITCLMAAVRPDALVNQGPYVALVDQNVCSNQTVAATSGVDSAAGIAPNYQSAVVNSLRASNSDPQRSEVWIDGTSNGQSSRIWVNLSVTSAPAASAPYGVFRLDFCQTPANSVACTGEGYVIGTSAALNFYQAVSGGDSGLTRALTLSTTGATVGSGAMSLAVGGSAIDYTFAYDATLFRRSDGSNDECFSRDASDPGTGFTGWSYGLYDATTGTRVNVDSGMPIGFTVNGVAYSAYVGYWGVSVPATAAGMLASGLPVHGLGSDATTGGSTTNAYTLIMAPGRLVRYSKQTAKLRDLDQIRFDVWINDATGLYSGAPSNTYYEAYWDDTTATFYISGIVNCTTGGCTTSALATAQAVSAAFWIPLGGIQAWSQSFGGDLYINLQGASLPLASTQVPVAYRSQSLVYPDQMPATLYCVNDCPTSATLASFFTPSPTASSPYGTSFNNYAPTGDAAVVTYTSDGVSGVLADSAGQPVVLTNPAALATQPQYLNGVSSGRLFMSLVDAQCVPGTAGQYCDYKVSNLPDYYVWQTGSQPWNQFAGLKDATGAFVPFSAPLNVSYAVPNSSIYGAYAGTSVVLQYAGFGQLYGFPTQCIDASTNLTAPCTAANARMIPAFMIPMDASAGVVTGATKSYLVKWLNREIRLAVKDPSLCLAAGLTLPVGLALPGASGLVSPANPGTPVYIGAEPTVTTAPRVIQGVVEY